MLSTPLGRKRTVLYLPHINNIQKVTLKKRKSALQIVTEAISQLGVPGTRCSWFLVAHPRQDPVTVHVSHLASHLQGKKIQICRAEGGSTPCAHVPRLGDPDTPGAVACLPLVKSCYGQEFTRSCMWIVWILLPVVLIASFPCLFI